MKFRINKRLLWRLELLIAALFICAREIVENEQIKSVLNIIAIIAGLFFVVEIYMNKLASRRTRKKYEALLGHLPGLHLFRETQETREGAMMDHDVKEAKGDFLDITLRKCRQIRSDMTDTDIFALELDLDLQSQFKPGSGKTNSDRQWQERVGQKQFQVILGQSGNGKSFELVKRALFYGEEVEKRSDTIFEQKIPVFIELKSFDPSVDPEVWIFKYLLAGKAGFDSMDEDWLRSLIEKRQLAYFMDGLDEVSAEYRDQCLEEIVNLSKITSVFFTCQQEVFKRFEEHWEYGDFNKPAIYTLPVLNRQTITAAIYAQKNRSDAEQEQMLEFLLRDNLIDDFTVPLLLNLYLNLFFEIPPEKREELRGKNGAELFNVLWEEYEDFITGRKLQQRLNQAEIMQYRTYTVWVAKIMREQPFFVEKIQPNWLARLDENGNASPSVLLRFFYFLTTRLLSALLLGIAVGAIVATPYAFLGNSILGGGIVAIFDGLIVRRKRQMKAPKKWSIALLGFALILACGLYQGFAVPRSSEDMLTPFFSQTETYPGIVMALVFGLIFSYRITLESLSGQYILPIEKLKIKWKSAFKAGALWGAIVGMIFGVLGLAVKNYYPDSSFYSRWLQPYLQEILQPHASGAPKLSSLTVFLFGFGMSALVAFLVVFLLASRDIDSGEQDEKKDRLNYGILHSFQNALIHTCSTALLSVIVYLLLNFRQALLPWPHQIISMISGISLMSFLWFGGIEVINHSLLRLTLYVQRIAPLDYDPWFRINRDIAVVRSPGASIRFYHNTLERYFRNYRLPDNPRVIFRNNYRKAGIGYSLLLAFALYLIGLPFINRYYHHIYWHKPNELILDASGMKRVSDTTYQVLTSGKLQFTLSGTVNVGTVTGRVSPRGTLHGFLYMPMQKAYNYPGAEDFRHAAVLFRRARPGSGWSAYEYLSPSLHAPGDSSWLQVQSGAVLQFIVNDRDWYNNSGHFRLKISVITGSQR